MISAEEFLAGRQLAIDPEESGAWSSRDVTNGYASGTSAQRTVQRRHKQATVGHTGQGYAPRRGSFRCAQAQDPEDRDECMETALRLLDAAARSTGMLRTKLAERNYAPDAIDATIDRLLELQLLNDRAYAESVTRSCVHRLMGRRGVEQELRRKGVDRHLAQQVAKEAEDQGVFVDAAWELGRKVAKKTSGLDLQVRRRRFWSAGARKGHNGADLSDVAATLFCS